MGKIIFRKIAGKIRPIIQRKDRSLILPSTGKLANAWQERVKLVRKKGRNFLLEKSLLEQDIKKGLKRISKKWRKKY